MDATKATSPHDGGDEDAQKAVGREKGQVGGASTDFGLRDGGLELAGPSTVPKRSATDEPTCDDTNPTLAAAAKEETGDARELKLEPKRRAETEGREEEASALRLVGLINRLVEGGFERAQLFQLLEEHTGAYMARFKGSASNEASETEEKQVAIFFLGYPYSLSTYISTCKLHCLSCR